MQLGVDQMLQLVRGLAFFGIDACLDEQGLGVDSRLLQRQPERVILRGEGVLES
jgi:hypothetical protein